MLSREAVISKLRQLGVTPSKERGQNFLLDIGALSDLAIFGNPQKHESILEIGPGLGALTAELSDSKNLTLVEIEPNFCEHLKTLYPQAKIISQDVLSIKLSELSNKDKWTIFGNLPYSLSTDIMLWLIDQSEYIERSVVLLQKEFSERIFAQPGTKNFGSLTLQVQLVADVIPGPILPGSCFFPQAAVESQAIELKFLSEPRFPIKNKALFDRLVRAAFMKRRKKLLNSIKASSYFDEQQVVQAMELIGIGSNQRAESLSLKDFCELANCLA